MRDKIALKIVAILFVLLMLVSCVTPCIAVDNHSPNNASNPFGDIFTSENTTTNNTPFPLSSNTIYVPDDYLKIQWAVDNASEGDTIIVRNGTYYENVVINKTLNLIGEDENATIIDGGGVGDVVYVSADWVNIRGFTIRNCGAETKWPIIDAGVDLRSSYSIISNNIITNNMLYGIWVQYSPYGSLSDNNIISDNTVSNNKGGGIDLGYNSYNNTVTNNIIYNNGDFGIIFLEHSHNNTIIGNNVSYNNDGIATDTPCNNNIIRDNVVSNNRRYGMTILGGSNTLRNNTMSGNLYNFIAGPDLDLDIDASNLVEGKPIYYLIGEFNTIIDPSSNAGTIYCVNCNNVTIKDLTLTHNGYGVYFYNTSNSTIQNNHLSNNTEAIYLRDSCNDNTITDNYVSNNENHGISLSYSNINNISNNIVNNNWEGIYLSDSNDNTIIGNDARNNNWTGIQLTDSNYNVITINGVSNNEQGIRFWYSHNNKIYLNNFLNNDDNVYSYSSTNIWNSTEKITYTYNGSEFENYLGNYWDDFSDTDANGDGIWDNLYCINGDKDWYPLKERFENYVEHPEPTCKIELQKDGVKIDRIKVWEVFDIVITDYSGDIEQVRFLSDEYQNGKVDEGFTWTDWYDWDTSKDDWTGYWDAFNKIKTWAFITPGEKEVWAEVNDSDGRTAYCSAGIYAVFEPFTFVHITDVHIGCSDLNISEERCKESTERSVERFTDIIEMINILRQDVDFVLITGDLVEYGEVDFFGKFYDALESLDQKIKVYIIPGNHDRYTTYGFGDNLTSYHDFIKANPDINHGIEFLLETGSDNYPFEHNDYLFIGLDSGRDVNPLVFSGSGLSNDQIMGLNSLPYGIPKIIFMHHPAVDDIWSYFSDPRIQHNRPEFINYCKDNNVSLVLTGHTHKDKIFNAKGKRVDINSNDRPLFIQTTSVKDYSKCRVIQVSGDDRVIWHSTDWPVCWKESLWIDGKFGIFDFQVSDSQGRHTGIDSSGNILREISHSYYIGDYGGMNLEGIILHDPTEEYKLTVTLKNGSIVPKTKSLQIQDLKIGSFNLSIKNQKADSLTTISYYNITVTENTTATVNLNKTTTNYTMEIDYNGDNITDETKDPDSLETNYAPTATIISPENNSTFVHGDEITFNGTGTDPEDGISTNTSLVWTSDIYGIIGIGNKFNTPNLSAGTHKIMLMVNDSTGLIDIDSVEITVIAPDLSLNSSDISFSNPNPTEGEIVTINATIRNLGLINATNVIVQFFDGIPEFEISNVTINAIRTGENETVNVTWNTTGKMGNHSISVMIDPNDLIEEMSETNNRASKSIVINEKQTQITFFDTGKGTYPSIMGNHTGTIKPNHTVIASKLYTYPCPGTGGHTDYAEIGNATWNATATWKGYRDDWHNITFDKTVVLLENKTYTYTIRTGSYPQIIHEQNHTTLDGSFINCTKFTDANGKTYTNWIPAIRSH